VIVVMVVALAAGSPVRASAGLSGIPPGDYAGVVIFTLVHSWDLRSPTFPVNNYSLIIDGKGSIRFTAHSDGSFSQLSLTVPSISYVVTGQEVFGPDTDGPCKGFSELGGGIGSISAPPGLIPSGTIAGELYTPAVKLNPGETWGEIQSDGDCSAQVAVGAFIEAIKYDIDSMPADRWDFTTDSRFTTKLAGTCTTELWLIAQRSMTCFWQAFRIPSR
jgi:hypothetical protein